MAPTTTIRGNLVLPQRVINRGSIAVANGKIIGIDEPDKCVRPLCRFRHSDLLMLAKVGYCLVLLTRMSTPTAAGLTERAWRGLPRLRR